MEKLMRIVFVSVVVLLLTGLGAGTVWATWIVPPPNLESWWPGDGNANDIWHLSPNNGTWRGGPGLYTAPGNLVEEAFKLDGTNDYIDIGEGIDLQVSGPHTAIAWVYAHENDEEDIVSKWAQKPVSSAYKAEFLLELYGGKVRGHIGKAAGGWTEFDGATTVTTETWHLVAQVWDGTMATVYLDGVQDSTPVAAPAPTPSKSAFLIGARSHDGTSLNMRTKSDINGYVDEVQVFSRALTAPEILAEYNAGSDGKFKFKPGTCVEPFADLVSWWPGEFDAADIIAPNYNAVPRNGATYDAAGKVGAAFKLSGTDDYFQVGSVPDLQVSGAHTAIAWVYAHENDEEDIVSKWAQVPFDSSYEAEFLLELFGGKVRGHIGDGAGSWTEFDGATTVTTETWHLVAQVWDGTMATVYLDGVQDSTPVAAPAPTPSSSAFLIGARSQNGKIGSIRPSTDINGLVDEVQIYNRALTADEIYKEYLAGSAGKCVPPGTGVNTGLLVSLAFLTLGTGVFFTRKAGRPKLT